MIQNRFKSFLTFFTFLIYATLSTAQLVWNLDEDDIFGRGASIQSVHLLNDGRTVIFEFGKAAILDPEGNILNTFQIPFLNTDCALVDVEDGLINIYTFHSTALFAQLDLDGNVIARDTLASADNRCFRNQLKLNESYFLLSTANEVQIYNRNEGNVRRFVSNYSRCTHSDDYFIIAEDFNGRTDFLVTVFNLTDFNAVSEYFVDAANQLWLDESNNLIIRDFDPSGPLDRDILRSYNFLTGELISEQTRNYSEQLSLEITSGLIESFGQSSDNCHYGIASGNQSVAVISGDPSETLNVITVDHRFFVGNRNEKIDGAVQISVNDSNDAIGFAFERVFRINNICQNVNTSLEDEEEPTDEEQHDMSNQDFQNIYPWITTDILGQNCENLTLSEYAFEGFSFVYFSDGRLYFEDGSLFCQASNSIDCFSAYGLTNDRLANEWTCSNTTNTDENDEMENEMENETMAGNEEAIQQYPWLSNVDLSSSCEIEEYDLGPFAFLYITNEDSGTLYFDDGTFYCQSSSTRDCRALYDLSSDQLTNVWSCSSEQETNMGEENDPLEDMENDTNSNDLFSTYDWLNSVLSSDCNSGVITEYLSGPFAFLLIEFDGSTDLYFQDGTYYCNQTETFDCLLAYDLTEVGRTFSCSGFSQDSERRSFDEYVPDFNIYPNPAGLFVNIVLPKSQSTIELISSEGKLIQRRNNDSMSQLCTIDMSQMDQGIYYVKVKTDKTSKIKKFIKL